MPTAMTPGVRYIWQRAVVLGAISLDFFAVLPGGVGTPGVVLLWCKLFPELARRDGLRPTQA